MLAGLGFSSVGETIVNSCINKYDTDKPYEVIASPALETNMMQKDSTRYLHLINFQNVHTGSRKKALYDPIEKIMPVYNIKVKVRDENVKKVILRPDGCELNFSKKDGLVEFTVPEVHIHQIVELC